MLRAPALTLAQGLWYFCTHPDLWPLLKGRLLPCFLLSIFVFANLFIWTYLPQVAFLYLFHKAGAWVNGTFLVLGEGAAIVAILFEAFFVDETQVDLFDAVRPIFVVPARPDGVLAPSQRPAVIGLHLLPPHPCPCIH